MARTFTQLEALGLEARQFNALKRRGINTVEELSKMSVNDLSAVPNLGPNSIAKIQNAIRDFNNLVHIEDVMLGEENNLDFEIEEQPNMLLKLVNIDSIGLDPDVLKDLEKEGINTLYDYHLKNSAKDKPISRETYKKLMRNVKTLLEEMQEDKIDNEGKRFAVFIAAYLLPFVPNAEPAIFQMQIENVIAAYKSSEGILDQEKFLNSNEFNGFLLSPFMTKLMAEQILSLIKEQRYGIDVYEAKQSLPAWFSEKSIDQAFTYGESQNLFRKNAFDRWSVFRPSLLEFVESLSDERIKKVLIGRFNGETLEEIAKEMGVTRERIRQIESQAKKRIPNLMEDDYVPLYETYLFTKEEFCALLEVPDVIFGYVKSKAKKSGGEPVENLLEESILSIRNQYNLNEIISKDSILIDGIRLPKKAQKIIDYLVRQHFNTKFPLQEFYEIYNSFLTKHGLSGESLGLNIKAFKGQLDRNPKVLSSQSNTYVILDVEAIDIDEFYDELELKKLIDVEISSKKLYNSHLELMDAYRIPDHYFLHNLLKKLSQKKKLQNFDFSRTPIIRIGNGNRDTQIENLLYQYSPISQEDLSQLYYEEYGVERKTFESNFLKNFQVYCNNRIYNIELKSFTEEQCDFLQTRLTGDFYSTEKVKEWFEERFNLPAEEYFNRASFASIGFILNEHFVVKSQYGSIKGYIEKEILSRGYINLNKLDPDLIDSMSFRSFIYNQQKEDALIEYQPREFVTINQLESQYSIDRNWIESFRSSVFQWVADNSYFTIESLTKSGFDLPENPGSFDYTFFSNLLFNDKERFYAFRFGGNRIFCKVGNEPVASSFLETLVKDNRGFAMNALIGQLSKKYGVNVNKYKIINSISESALYYEPNSNYIYSSYEAFLQTRPQ